MSDHDIALKVQNLSKKFARSLKRQMLYGLHDVARAALIPHRFRSPHLAGRLSDEKTNPTAPPAETGLIAGQGLRPTEFWALQDVTFEHRRGECLGVIGHNGAGKSTLFSILSGIYGPTSGRVEIRGRLQALIALGAGFHPSLTGRENIYINASILGLRTREIDAMLEDIIDFSEVGDFIDMPVKNYSSGMMVRLGFSVAINLKPDVLLVDEVLAVGDISFQNKSFAKMKALITSGVPVLFVSHWPQAVEVVASRVLWLDHGKVRGLGETKVMLREYIEFMNELDRAKVKGGSSGLFPIKITDARLLDPSGASVKKVRSGQDLRFVFRYDCTQPVSAPYFSLRLRRPGSASSDFASCCMLDDGIEWDIKPGEGTVECVLKAPALAPGPYEVKCGIRRTATMTVGQSEYQDFFTALDFTVDSRPADLGLPGLMETFAAQGACSPVLIPHTWTKS